MQNVLRLPDHVQQGISHPATEEEAIAAARAVAEKITASHTTKGASNDNLPYRELEWVAQSGLLGVTVPHEFGGPDLANASLAEIVAILSQADPLVAESLKSHFHVLEALRTHGSKSQQKFFFGAALKGEQFCVAILNAATQLDVDAATIGYRLNGETLSIHALFSDWIVFAFNNSDKGGGLVFVHRDEDALAFHNAAEAPPSAGTTTTRVTVTDLPLAGDRLVTVSANKNAASTLDALQQLLDSAIDLGTARALFADLSLRQREVGKTQQQWDQAQSSYALDVLGRLAARIEGVAAMVERAGLHLDIAQVDETQETALRACVSATSVGVLSADVVRDAVSALIDLYDGHLLPNAAQTRYRRYITPRAEGGSARHRQLLGNYLVNGIAPGRWTQGERRLS